MSTMVTIDRLEALYHDVRPGEAEQFDRTLTGLLTAELGRAIDRRMATSDAEICIPELHVALEVSAPHDVRLVARMWADEIVDAITRRAGSSSGVVVYRNRIDALVDFVRSMSRGRHERMWAWQQIGFVNPDVSAPTSEHVTRALIAHPEMASGVLQQLVGPKEIHLDAPQWIRLAVAVDRFLGPMTKENPPARQMQQGSVGATERALSSMLPWSQADDDQRLLLGRLVIAVCSPEKSASHRCVQERVARWAGHVPADRTSPNDPDDQPNAPTESMTWNSEADSVTTANESRTTPGQQTTHGPADRTSPNDPDDQTSAPTESMTWNSGAGPVTTANESRTTTGHQAPSAPADAVDFSDSDVPAESTATATAASNVQTSVFGGVVFAPHCLEAIGLVQRIVDAGLGFSPSSVLAHVLAEASDAELTDPAVLTIAGCDGDDFADDIDTDTLALVASWSQEIVAWLRDRLDLEAADGLSWFWGRQAEIRSEPGWIEIDLPLDSVDMRIRAAGLDLDPDFVWWLGSVVRYRYV